MEKTLIQRYLLLQINDALFPIGGYAHSYGLETFIQYGIVHNEESARTYLHNILYYNYCYTEGLAVKLAYEYARNNDTEALEQLHQLTEAVKVPMELRQASIKLSSRFTKTVKQFDVDYALTIFNDYEKSHTVTYYAITYGLFCASCDIELAQAMEAFIYSQTSASITNLVKTVPLSQTSGQKLLAECHKIFIEVNKIIINLSIEDYGRSTPGFDIRCMQHEGLYSRIYMS